MGLFSNIGMGIGQYLTEPKSLVNPNLGLDANNRYIDTTTGKPTDPFIKPGIGTWAFDPELGRALQQQNAQYEMSGLEAQRKQGLERQLLGNQVDTMPAENNPFYHSFVTPTDGSQNLPDPKTFLPEQRNAWITSLENPSLAPTVASKEAMSQGAIDTRLLPSTGANIAKSGNVNSQADVNDAVFQLGLQPAKQTLAKTNLGNQSTVAGIQSTELGQEASDVGITTATQHAQRLNDLTQSGVQTTKLGTDKLIADTIAAKHGWVADTTANNLLKGLHDSATEELSGSPYVGNVNGTAGTIKRGFNPLFTSPMDKMSYMNQQPGMAYGLPGAVMPHEWSANQGDDNSQSNGRNQAPTGLIAGISPQAQGIQSTEPALGVEDVLPRYGLRLNSQGEIERSDSPGAELTPQQRQIANNLINLMKQGKIKLHGGYAKQSLYGSILQAPAPSGGSTIASIPAL